MPIKLETLGPWGNLDSPLNWHLELGPDEAITELTIHHGFIVDGINFVVKDSGTGRTTSKMFGGNGGRAHTIQMRPDEYITNIIGTYGLFTHNGQWLIGSIMIHTNYTSAGYGPYGANTTVEDIHKFSASVPSGYAIAGFCGRQGYYVESIGVYVKMKLEKRGPWGNLDLPVNWHLELGPDEVITEITIRHGFIVDGINFVVADSRTGSTTSIRFGGTGGSAHTIQMRPNEYITNISGKHGLYTHNGQWLIGSIIIHTNYNPAGYGPYGANTTVTDVHNFSTSVPSGYAIAGFYGRQGFYVECIGVYVRKKIETNRGLCGSSKSSVRHVKQKIEKHGPWGNLGRPLNWHLELDPDEAIKEVIIWHGSIVDGIVFVINNGHVARTTSRKLGGAGTKSVTIQMRPNEKIINISGKYGLFKSNGEYRIGSITIHTNLKPYGYGPYGANDTMENLKPYGYGPYGANDTMEDIHEFSSSLPSGYVIAGFCGRAASKYVESIGVYVKMKIEKYGPWGSPYPPNWNLELDHHETIKVLTIRHGSIIDGFEFQIEDNHTKRITNRSFGGSGESSDKIELGANEHITDIRGTCGLYTMDGHQHVTSITIHTNLSRDGYGPYGTQENCQDIHNFSCSLALRYPIVGFFGRAAQHIDCIGVYVKNRFSF